MKVVHIIVGLSIGGAELMLKRLIESQAIDLRYDHTVISLTSIGAVGEALREQGIKVYVLNLRGLWGVPLKCFVLLKLIRQLNPDIVQTWMYHADLLGGLACRLAGIKTLIWGIRTTDVSDGGARATGLVRWLCARLSHFLPHTIICAAEASRTAHVALGYRADRMIVVPNGFDLARLKSTPQQVAALRSKCGFSVETVVVGTLGRFNAVKDPHNFVRAAGLLAREYPKVHFLMVGRGCDAANAQLIGWIAAAGCAERFVLLGERTDVPVCLSAMDVFCLSSRTEGFPNVVGEAMAMSKVCVVTDVGDAAHLLGNCGVVVPSRDSAALAEGMAKLVAVSVVERNFLGARAHVRIATEFTMGRTREQFEMIYANVLSDQTPQQGNSNKQG